MSLNDIVLPAKSVVALYKNYLVEDKSYSTLKPLEQGSIAVLGKNLNRVIILVANKEAAFLPDEELNFLLGILSACKLNMDDVGIVNLAKNETLSYTQIINDLKAEKLLLFGVKPDEIQLPLSFPHYQLQRYNEQLYLAAPALSNLQDNKDEKLKLWNCLKQIFLS